MASAQHILIVVDGKKVCIYLHTLPATGGRCNLLNGYRCILYNTLDNLHALLAAHARTRGGEQAMSQDTWCQVFNIIRLDIVAPVQCGQGFACSIEGKGATRADAKLNGRISACRTHDCKEVTFYLGLPIHLTNDILQLKDLVGSDH